MSRVDRPSAVNMADVARLAGVSTATVSRALRGVPGVSEATRAKVEKLADELAYVVSPEASRLAGGTTGRVAVLVPKLNSWFFSAMLDGVEGALRAADLDMLVYQVRTAEQRRSFFDRLPARRKVDAVIIIALPLTEQETKRLELLGVEVVLAGGRLDGYPSVSIDDVEAARQAVDHLILGGHERIAMIKTADPDGTIWASDRARSSGYQQALEKAGLPLLDELSVTVTWGIDGGARAMDRLLSLREPPTAVFAFSDEVAFGALRTLRRSGISVPEHMSLIGVDDHPMAELTDLTTIHQSVEQQGAMSGRLAVSLLDGEDDVQLTHTVATHLVIRGTTGPVSASLRSLRPARS